MKKNNLPENYILITAPNHVYWDIIEKWIIDNVSLTNSPKGGNLLVFNGINAFYSTEPAINLSTSNYTRLNVHQFIGLSGIWIPKRGEVVEVKQYGNEDVWYDAIYLQYVQGSKYPYLVVAANNENDFQQNKPFCHTAVRLVRKKTTKITMQMIANKFGVNVNDLEIID